MKTFMEQYQEQIEPRINAIDLFIKTQSPPYCLSETAKLLQISEKEIEEIMSKEQISSLDRSNFFQIMKKGSSSICRMFARELSCGCPHFYTAENISYIYDLDISTVLEACKTMGIHYFSAPMVKILFQHIPVNAGTQ